MRHDSCIGIAVGHVDAWWPKLEKPKRIPVARFKRLCRIVEDRAGIVGQFTGVECDLGVAVIGLAANRLALAGDARNTIEQFSIAPHFDFARCTNRGECNNIDIRTLCLNPSQGTF